MAGEPSSDSTERLPATAEAKEERERERSEAGPRIHPRYIARDEIGRGGLGRVLRAHDTRLDRPVAIKELHSHDRDARSRFEREAALTARLQHPSIVPLYDADSWTGGDPFYAMKMVSGKTLEALIAAAPRFDARLPLLTNVLAVVDAVAYAHREGIIHRDLKPANVLVGAFGETMVIDWGLAKDLRAAGAPGVAEERRGGSAGDSADATVAGSVLGTPRYMAPEQARGGEVDERADVYALGAMLYHLLAGVPPYQGHSAHEVLAMVDAGPPPPLAAVQPAVATDLATIVDKAMARAPAGRYPSARELAEELRRFLSGQLVRSHAYTLEARLRRFAARHRTAVIVGSVMLAVLAVVAGLGLSQIVRERNAARAERRIAEQQRAAAESLVHFAVTDLRDRLQGLGHLELLGGLGVQIERYQKAVAAADPRGSAPVDSRAGALELLGDVRRDQGDLAGALALYREALAMRQARARDAPGGTDWAEGLLRNRRALGDGLRQRGDLDAALASNREGLKVAEELARRQPADPTWHMWRGGMQRAIGDVLDDKQETGAALLAYQAALGPLVTLAALEPGPRAALELDAALAALSREQRIAGDLRGALANGRAARDIVEGLLPDGARSPDASLRDRLAHREDNLCRTFRLLGDVTAARGSCRRAREVGARLVELDPGNATWRVNTAIAGMDVADVERALGDLEAAARGYAAARELLTPMVAGAPAQRGWASWLARADAGVAGVAEARGDPAEALRGYRAVVARLEEPFPTEPFVVRQLARGHAGVARALLAGGDLDGALARAMRALEITQALARATPDPDSENAVAARQLDLGRVLARRGDLDGARRAFAAARDIDSRLMAAAPADASLAVDVAIAGVELGAAALAAGDPRAALVAQRAALALVEPLAGGVTTVRYLGALADARARTAATLERSPGGAAEARRLVEEAAAVLDGLRAHGRLDAEGQRLLVDCQQQLRRR